MKKNIDIMPSRGSEQQYFDSLIFDQDAQQLSPIGVADTRVKHDFRSPAFVAKDDTGRLLGFISGGTQPERGIAKVDMLYVNEKDRGSGVGSSLLLHIENYYCKFTCFEYVRIDVYKDNDQAIKFYSERGYKSIGEVELGRRQDGQWIPLISMAKKIV